MSFAYTANLSVRANRNLQRTPTRYYWSKDRASRLRPHESRPTRKARKWTGKRLESRFTAVVEFLAALGTVAFVVGMLWLIARAMPT